MSFERIGKIKEAQKSQVSMGILGIRGAGIVLSLAITTASASALDLGGVGVGVDVSIGHGNLGVGVDVGASGGGVAVDVGIGQGESSASGGSGAGGPGQGSGGEVPVAGAGSLGDRDEAQQPVARKARLDGGRMPCAGGGNAIAFNGFVVRDRDGTAIGWVNDATIDPNQKIRSIKMQSNGKACYSLTGGTFRLADEEVWVNVDATLFR